MKDIDQDVNKITPDKKTRFARAKKISRLDRYELEEQIDSLQRAFAQERGENHKFRKEMRARFRQGF